MKTPSPGQTVFQNTSTIISEINELIHVNLDKKWMAKEWKKKEAGEPDSNVHPLVNVAFTAHQQIRKFVDEDAPGMTQEIFELAELAIKINALKKHNVDGLQSKLNSLISFDFALYRTARYEIQVAGMLLQREHQIEFIKEGEKKTPDILIINQRGKCEIECKHKEPNIDQLDYIKSIYDSTQTARKQFSKKYPGVISIEIDEGRFDEFQVERKRLEKEIIRAMRNSSSISAILLTSKIDLEEDNDYVYRHRVVGFSNTNARHSMPNWLANNLVNN
jgi:hypothetical protein